MSNTESDVLRTVPDERVWLVISGRWYRGDTLAGPWTWVEPDQLPASFRRIPADSAKCLRPRVRAGDGARPRGDAGRDDAAHGGGPPRGRARERDVGRRAEVRGRTRPRRRVRAEHAGERPARPRALLRLRPGRVVHLRRADGAVARRGLDPGRRHPDDPAGEPVYNTRYVSVYDSAPDTVYVAYTPAYSVLIRTTARSSSARAGSTGRGGARITTPVRGRGGSTRATRRGRAGAGASGGGRRGAASAGVSGLAGARAGAGPAAVPARAPAT